MEKSTIRMLGIISGVFFIIGAVLFGVAVNYLGSVISNLSATPINIGNAVLEITGIGSAIGIVIIALSATLVMSSSRASRVIAGVVIIVIGLYGSLYTLGGLVVGIILALIAGIAAIAHHEESQSSGEYGTQHE